MIDVKIEGRILKITDDWCDINTPSKIRGIMSRLSLKDEDIVDWEIRAEREICPTEEDNQASHEYGDIWLNRDRMTTTTCLGLRAADEETPMEWHEALDLELNHRCHPIELYILCVRR